ncbi:hypothetical protein B0H13DRAFT_2356702 [Mycena leptocephala]|nr:hypothetical protein B0H13DRAFT_2356702 [Mycena leptocephala]
MHTITPLIAGFDRSTLFPGHAHGRRQRAKTLASSTLLTSLTLICPPTLLFTTSTSPSFFAPSFSESRGDAAGGLGFHETPLAGLGRAWVHWLCWLLEGGDAVAQQAGLGLRGRGVRRGDVCTRSMFPRSAGQCGHVDIRRHRVGGYFTSKYKTRPEPRNASPEMCLSSFSNMKDASSHLHILPSLLLAFVAAIPNHNFRYTALGLFFGLFVLSTIYLRSPSTQLRYLALLIDQTEGLIRRAMAQCPRDYFSLTEEMGRLLEANKIASLLKCRILDSDGEQFSLSKFRMLSKDVATCAKRVRSIRAAALLIAEAEHQRKLTADIKETQFILAAIPRHP